MKWNHSCRPVKNQTYTVLHFQEMKKVCEYEIGGPGLLPLHNKSTLVKEEGSSDTDSDNLSTTCHQPSFLHMHPHLTSCKQLETMCRKAHLVMRLIEMRIGQEPLLQVR